MGDGAMMVRAFRAVSIGFVIAVSIPALILPMTGPALADTCDDLERSPFSLTCIPREQNSFCTLLV
jgi:hypothetical protein